jgi:DNA-binding winged helix-turn-helix (wHTH) protein
VRRIREKIERDPERPQYLQTVRGTGYRFDPDQKRNLDAVQRARFHAGSEVARP